MSLIFLIGMPAAGKSYWAQKIAEAYDFEYIDLDIIIEGNTGSTVSEIFAEQGEAVFREREREALQSVIQDDAHAIVACGGGTPCFFNNMDSMLQQGKVIYLATETDTLISRINTQHKERPLLKDSSDLKQQLEQLLHIRKPVFEKAHYILHVDNISLTNFEEIIS